MTQGREGAEAEAEAGAGSRGPGIKRPPLPGAAALAPPSVTSSLPSFPPSSPPPSPAPPPPPSAARSRSRVLGETRGQVRGAAGAWAVRGVWSEEEAWRRGAAEEL